MLEPEKKILQQEYQTCLKQVKKHGLLTKLTHEKLEHSLQVLDVGNYILKNENIFKNWSIKRIKEARIALLLHDIGRFQEIIIKVHSPTQNPDHGILGCNILANISQYNTPRIIIPVKHHGHMIEALYNDPQFYTLEDPQIKYEIEKTSFLVRDADKIANFQLLSKNKHDVWQLFGIHPHKQTPISEEAYQAFIKKEVILNQNIHTNSDMILRLICWIFDLNYQSSFAYMQNHQCFEILVERLKKSNSDLSKQKEIESIITTYLKEKKQNLKE